MAENSTYQIKTPPEDSDKVLGSTDAGITRNYSLSEIKDYTDIPTAIKEISGSFVGGDTSVVEVRGDDSLDVQSKRDAADFSHLHWAGTITSFEDAGGGSVKAYYSSDEGVEFVDGDTVTLADNVNYAGEYVIFNVIRDIEDSFQFTAVWVATGTATWTNDRLYDRLRPDENKNDNAWSLEAQTEFFAEAPDSITLGSRCKTLNGWEDDWSQGKWGFNGGYQNILGGIGCTISGNNNISENYWCTIIGNHNHVSEWSSVVTGSWNIVQGGDSLVEGSYNNTYGWKLICNGSDNYVSGNESQIRGSGNTIYDAYGITLNETPDALHNRFNIIIGQNCTIGSTSDLGDRATDSITAFADSGTVVPHINVSSTDHGLITGDAVSITSTEYNGKYSVTYIDDNTFMIKETFTSTDTGTWTQNYTINHAVLLGDNLKTEKDGAVAIGKDITNLFENSIEIGTSDASKIAIRNNGLFVYPSAKEIEPVLSDIPVGHSTKWYDTAAPAKLWEYRNDGGVLERTQLAGAFATV